MTIGTVHRTTKFARERLQEPSKFKPKSFRIIDIGKDHKLIVGRKKGKKTLEPQSLLHPSKESLKHINKEKQFKKLRELKPKGERRVREDKLS